jgi:hypothetical protein
VKFNFCRTTPGPGSGTQNCLKKAPFFAQGIFGESRCTQGLHRPERLQINQKNDNFQVFNDFQDERPISAVNSITPDFWSVGGDWTATGAPA